VSNFFRHSGKDETRRVLKLGLFIDETLVPVNVPSKSAPVTLHVRRIGYTDYRGHPSPAEKLIVADQLRNQKNQATCVPARTRPLTKLTGASEPHGYPVRQAFRARDSSIKTTMQLKSSTDDAYSSESWPVSTVFHITLPTLTYHCLTADQDDSLHLLTPFAGHQSFRLACRTYRHLTDPCRSPVGSQPNQLWVLFSVSALAVHIAGR
jgi:hypothetical protein